MSKIKLTTLREKLKLAWEFERERAEEFGAMAGRTENPEIRKMADRHLAMACAFEEAYRASCGNSVLLSLRGEPYPT